MDELAALTRHQREYRECSLLLFTETWLTALTPDTAAELDGFTLLRADRRSKESGKRKGGGLAVFVNDRWCNPGHITVKEQHCCKDIELLAVSMRPYYLPREFTHALVVVVYVPPSANADAACDVLLSAVSRLQTQHPDALLLISGDFNHASPSSSLPKFTQQPAVTRTVKKWSEEAEEALKDCFNTTLWDVFSDAHGEDIDSLTHCLTDYINFCVENTVPTRTVRSFSNSKPWITPDIKALLKEKRRAFFNRFDQASAPPLAQSSSAATPILLCAPCPLLLLCPLTPSHNPQFTPTPLSSHLPDTATSHSVLCTSPPSTPPCSSLLLTTHQVRNALKKNRARKAAGPGWHQLQAPEVLRRPAVWDFWVHIQPEPEAGESATALEDVLHRPSAKDTAPQGAQQLQAGSSDVSSDERRWRDWSSAHLRPLVSSFMDPLQFAYQPDIGVDDAVIYLLHTSLTHLEKAWKHCEDHVL
ncbi:hypothetical protein L3Q82_015622 [Scortum barcoo]|uniref:Uncharacterized protein n=1 Tax=Scortum barcoo TaxID=214431 RepID=A0ACB8VP31_9TELE|nr:hypothetical protein L3Q82_015622 [Scortum barcoo]